jgi:hypothetical protein
LCGKSGAGYPITPLTYVFELASFVPALAVAVRRMHDINKSGWNILWLLLPLIGFIIYLIFLCRPGDKGPNRFGADPLGSGSPQNRGLSPDRYEQLEKLSRLHKDGALTKEEFEAQKAAILGTT